MTSLRSPLHYQRLEIGRDASTIKYTVLRARLRVAEKFHFRSATRANCLSRLSALATYKRISAGIVARITLAVNSFTIHRACISSLFFSPSNCSPLSPPFSFPRRNRRPLARLPSPFLLLPGPGIVHLSSISRRVHFIFANRAYTGVCGRKFMNKPIAREGTGARDFAGGEKYVRPVLHARVLRPYVAAGQVGR